MQKSKQQKRAKIGKKKIIEHQMKELMEIEYLKQKHNKPWVADFRDEWTNNPYVKFNKQHISTSKHTQNHNQRQK